MQQEQEVSVDQVVATIRAVLSVESSIREPAESSLRSWEVRSSTGAARLDLLAARGSPRLRGASGAQADAVPGFLIALMNIVGAAGQIDEVRTRAS